ncbi:MAG: hypothetical protein DRQ62_13925, partial [Gammaproteobacteria bacterium]
EDLKKDAKLKSDNVNFMCSQQDFIDLMNENERLTAILDRLGEPELMGVTPEHTNWLEIYQTEFDARIEYAKNRGGSDE